MSTHDSLIQWALKPGEDFLAGHYSRGHTIGFDHGVTLPASASPAVVRAPWSMEAAADPEELLVASLASCHMLWFLDFAKHAGVLVKSYRDAPVGVMGKIAANGKIGLARCTLRPYVETDASREALNAIHHQAHAACNIANSVLTEVIVDPVYEAAPAPAPLAQA